MSVSEQTIAGLDNIVVGDTSETPAVVLLHGYGASFRDLFPLYQMLRPQSDCTWYFPNGPERVQIGMPEFGSAWFPLDVERLINLSSMQNLDRVAEMAHPGMEEMTNQIYLYLQELAKKHSHIILGGFSQGAILSTNVALMTDIPLTALTLFSASMAQKSVWEKNTEHRRGLPVFQSHGHHDPVLPFILAEQLRDLLMGAGFAVAFHDFSGAHEIPLQVLDTYRSFLDQLITSLGD